MCARPASVTGSRGLSRLEPCGVQLVSVGLDPRLDSSVIVAPSGKVAEARTREARAR